MKSVKFYRDNDTVRVISIDTETLTDKLEPAVYTLGFNMFMGFFLTFKCKKFEVPKKIYGSTRARSAKIIGTYESRELSTGVLLTGDKGGGKTMLSSLVANEMIDKGLPVILIEEAHAGAGFNEIINNIGEAVLFFDEFGKIFKEKKDQGDPQDKLLSIFDGTQAQKRLIILTENKEGLINEYMKNRPGRIYYHFKYKKLEEAVIKEYAADFGVPENVIEQIALRCDKSHEFSFDVLKAIVEEYKRFGGDIDEICKDLNIEQPYTQESEVKVVTIHDAKQDKEFQPEITYRKVRTPRTGSDGYVSWIDGKDDDGEPNYQSTSFGIKDIIKKVGTRTIYKKGHIIVVTEEDSPTVYGTRFLSAYDF